MNIKGIINIMQVDFCNITIDDIYRGRSEAHNRIVAHFFKKPGLIEQSGSGINRIITACKDQGLEAPKIAEKNDFFDVEIMPSITTLIKYNKAPY